MKLKSALKEKNLSITKSTGILGFQGTLQNNSNSIWNDFHQV